MPVRSRVVRCVASAALATFALGASVHSSAAQEDRPVPPFDGSAAADGARLRLEIPGAPLTSRLVDGGAPTVQVAATSVGTSRGYAAFPDPGEIVQSAPGIFTGLLNQGAGGLPPISLPTLPTFPLLVTSDVNGTQHAEVGEGPYELRADSVENNSSASAIGGLQTGVGGNIALVRADAETGVQDDGSVLATATSDIQGLTIGPLSIGRVTSTATLVMAPDGAVTPSSDITISSLRVGGIDVAVDPDGLVLGSVPVPLPIGSSLAGLLEAAGLDVEFVAAQEFDNAVIAPTLVISTPVETDLGSDTGTLSLTAGGATAALTGAAPRPAPPAPPAQLDSPDLPPSSSDSTSSPSRGASPEASRPSTPGPVASGPSAVPAGPGSSDGALAGAPTRATGPDPGELLGLWDIRSTYLATAGCAAGLYALSQLIRILGVRIRWISSAG